MLRSPNGLTLYKAQVNAMTGVTKHLLKQIQTLHGINQALNLEVRIDIVTMMGNNNNYMFLGRQWSYLQCTQSALFQITDQVTWMPNRLELPYRVEQCKDVLGAE